METLKQKFEREGCLNESPCEIVLARVYSPTMKAPWQKGSAMPLGGAEPVEGDGSPRMFKKV